MEEKLEPFFCDRLTADENRAAHAHLESCSDCRATIQEFTALDPLIKKVFQQNLAISRMPRQRRSPLTISAFAAAIAFVILLLVWMPSRQSSNVQTAHSPTPTVAATPLDTASVPKINEPAPPERAKPEAVIPDRPATVAPQAVNSERAGKAVPDFLITDFAGYSRSIGDYRGSVLIFGVLGADQPQAVSNLQKVYETFGKNTKLRIVGVLNQRGTAPAGATFTMAYNEGSALLGATASDVVIVDETGTVRFRGSLLESSTGVLNSVRTTLRQLNIQN